MAVEGKRRKPHCPGSPPNTYDTFMANREDIIGKRLGNGAKVFRFYQDANRFSRRHPAVRVQSIDIIHVNDEDRVQVS